MQHMKALQSPTHFFGTRGFISVNEGKKSSENDCSARSANQAGWPGCNGHPGGTHAVVMPQPGPLGPISPSAKRCSSEGTTPDSMCGNLAAAESWERNERSQGTG